MKRLYRQLCLLALSAFCSSAQEYRATITGTVLDKSGAAVPKVNISATRVGTNLNITTQTNDSGFYTLPFLIPDRYNIEFKAEGFQVLKRQGIVLQVNDRLNISVELTVGSVTNEITVVGEQEIINTSTASRGLVFDPIKMQEILRRHRLLGHPWLGRQRLLRHQRWPLRFQSVLAQRRPHLFGRHFQPGPQRRSRAGNEGDGEYL